MYLSAIFYTVDAFPEAVQRLLLLNPLYVYISFFRQAVIGGSLPDLLIWILSAGYALAALAVGLLIYRKSEDKFLYYV